MTVLLRAGAAAAATVLALAAPAGAQTRSPADWPFAASSPWNSPLGTGAQHNAPLTCDMPIQNEAQKNGQPPNYIPWINAESYGIPVAQASLADPLKTYLKNGTPQGQFHVPSAATPAAGTDRHLAVIEPGGSFSDESWLTTVNATTVDTGHFSRQDLVNGSGWQDPSGSGIRAAKASILGGLMRTSELQQGEIRHALAMALPPALLWKFGPVAPATGLDGDTSQYGGTVKMGQLVRLPVSVNVETLPISATAKVIARALQRYGAYVVDKGGSLAFYAEPSGQALVSPVRSSMDLRTLVSKLTCVTNNQGPNWGGGGTPLAPPAPPFGQ